MRKILVAGCLLLVISLLTSCGLRTESSRYYYSPSWTQDGKVIFIGATESVDKDILGSRMSSSYSEYVMTMYPAGTGESGALFSVTDAPPYAMSCSPTRDYVAYMDDLRSGLFGKIVIRSISTEAFTGMRRTELSFYPKIKSFDWSDTGNQLVYCTTQEVRIVDIDGSGDTLVTAEANLEFVTWKYGSQIAFVSSSEGTVLINSDGTSPEALVGSGVVVNKPQISQDLTKVYGIMGESFVEVNINTGVTTKVVASFTGLLPRLSPDATMVTYSKSGEDSGIYVLNIGTGTEEAIR